ncbi:MAG TPA: hypothetical protein VNR51_03110 [Hyphomicrobium sp.]|nr:hypothetical protein [Hyphomicrobium sp.]
MLGRKLNWAVVCAVALTAMLFAIGLASVDRVAAGQCGGSCRNAYNQCRMSTKGSPSCEVAFTKCMQSCIKR